jgi:hypothetical protein
MEDIFGIFDFFSGILDWAPSVVDVVETVVELVPDGGSSEPRPANRRNGQPDDGSIDW